jgi:dolichyl-phosphate beta-glucosyltransferase
VPRRSSAWPLTSGVERLADLQKTVLIVPCYNEARRIRADAFVQAVATDPTLALLFVDDGSTDSTRAGLAQLCARRPEQMAVLGLERNVGKAEAVRAGLLAAFERNPSVVGYFDADLATPLSEVSPMRALFDEPRVEMVLGSRVALLGREIDRSPKRHYLGRVFATAASLVLGVQVYDTQCGAKLFRNTERTRRIFAQPFSVKWTFDVEILARLLGINGSPHSHHGGGLVVEYPLRGWRDVAGSKLGLGASLRAAADLLVVWARYRDEPPMPAAAKAPAQRSEQRAAATADGDRLRAGAEGDLLRA